VSSCRPVATPLLRGRSKACSSTDKGSGPAALAGCEDLAVVPGPTRFHGTQSGDLVICFYSKTRRSPCELQQRVYCRPVTSMKYRAGSDRRRKCETSASRIADDGCRACTVCFCHKGRQHSIVLTLDLPREYARQMTARDQRIGVPPKRARPRAEGMVFLREGARKTRSCLITKPQVRELKRVGVQRVSHSSELRFSPRFFRGI
jgi:hypothetical protein